MVHRFQLTFSLIDCTGCGASRIRAVACADCGKRPAPWETNDRPAARNAAIRASIQLLDQPGTLPAVDSFALEEVQQLLGRLEKWMSEFFRAVKRVSAEETGAADKLFSVIESLCAERALLTAAPRLRPYVRIIEYAGKCVSHLVEMAHCYLQALGSATPLEAQQRGNEAQSYLDSAAAEIEELGNFADLFNSILTAETVEDRLAILVQLAQWELDASDLNTLMSAADQSLLNSIGIPGGAGVGMQFALQDIAARFYGDQQRFRKIAAESYVILSRNPSLLSSLATSQDFLPDLRESLLELHDASEQVMRAVKNTSISRQVGRAIVDVAASLVEGPGQVLAIALLGGTGRKTRPYEKLRQDNATELLRAARNHQDFEPLLKGFSLELRTAQAHRMVRYWDDGVTLETKAGSGKIEWHALGDEVLTAYESAMGCMVGLQAALADSGVSVYGVDAYEAYGISASDMVAIGLVAEGCQDISIDEQEESWVIDLVAPPAKKLIPLVAGIAALVPRHITALTLRAEAGGRTRTLVGPTSPLRAFSVGDVDGDNYGMATTRMLYYWRCDGDRCISIDAVRRWAAYQVHLARLSNVINKIPRVRALRSLAAELGDVELTDVLTATIRSLRLGDQTDPSTATLVAKLSDWGNESVEWDLP